MSDVAHIQQASVSPPSQQQGGPRRRPEQQPLPQLDLAAALAAIGTLPPERRNTSPHLEKDAARAMSRTNSWQPASAPRRNSYDMEDRKRHLQMVLGGVGAVQPEPGFTERCA